MDADHPANWVNVARRITAEAEEALRREAEERERKARELQANQAQDRLDNLHSQAAGLVRAEAIRAYVEKVRSRRSEVSTNARDFEKWVGWALGEADRTDPIKNGTADHAMAEIAGLPEMNDRKQSCRFRALRGKA